jgi:hypothetical protein
MSFTFAFPLPYKPHPPDRTSNPHYNHHNNASTTRSNTANMTNSKLESPRTQRRRKRAQITDADAGQQVQRKTAHRRIGRHELNGLCLIDPVHSPRAERYKVRIKARDTAARRVAEVQRRGSPPPSPQTPAPSPPTSSSLPISAESDIHECNICAESYRAEDFRHLEGCPEEPNQCRNCFAQYLHQQVGDGIRMSSITCPYGQEDCKASFTLETVRQHASTDTFEQ